MPLRIPRLDHSLRVTAVSCWTGILVLLLLPHAARSTPRAFSYISPMHGSQHVSPHNNIVWRADHDLDRAITDRVTVRAVGAVSGLHTGTLTLSDDARTLVFVPATPFMLGERVNVRFTPRDGTESSLPQTSLEFSVAPTDPKLGSRRVPLDDEPEVPLEMATGIAAGVKPWSAPSSSVPSSYPPIIIFNAGTPEPGHLFVTPSSTTPGGHLVIMDNLGYPIFYRLNSSRVADFKMHSDGTLLYFDFTPPRFYRIDAAGGVIDSFQTGNGYETDLHDFQLLPNGHALLMAYDPQPVRMDTVVAGGFPGAIVTGLIIQELDAAKNVVFQWRSWDHFRITDAVECIVDFLAADVDYVHGNAIELDDDGNILLSSRHMNEITKINRQTGAIMWRMGPRAKNNQFTFVGDTRGFSHQHDIRRLPNGNITLLDNGNCVSPPYSRGVEYALNEQNKIATQVWQYRLTPDIYGRAAGNLQRRDNGSTLINWGVAARVTDLHADGTKSLELSFGAPDRTTYRAYRFPWRTTRFVTGVDSLGFGTVLVGDSTSRSLSIRNDWNQPVEIDEFASSSTSYSVPTAVPFTLAPGQTVVVSVKFKPLHNGPFNAILYVRSADNTELVAQTVTLTGTGSGPVTVLEDRPAVAFALEAVANPSHGATTITFAAPHAARQKLSVLDPQGRVVAVLADGVYAAGRHQVVWHAAGHAPAAPGIYFVRYEWPEDSAVRRVILMR